MTAARVKSQRGMTLTELLVAMAVSLVTIGAVYGVHLMQVRQQIVQEDVLAMQQNVRAAMDMMVREIRMAGYDPLGNGFHGLECTPEGLKIKSDLNGNGRFVTIKENGTSESKEVSDPHETLVYLYDDDTSTLRRKSGKGGRQFVADHIESFEFTCLDASGQTAVPPDTRAVEVKLTARTEHADRSYSKNDGYRTFTLCSRVIPRNLQ